VGQVANLPDKLMPPSYRVAVLALQETEVVNVAHYRINTVAAICLSSRCPIAAYSRRQGAGD
jgi:hypothetical protein